MDYKDYFKKNKTGNFERTPLELSHLITEARLYAGITQTELAQRMGIKQPTIARAESGKQEPSIGFLEKVAKAVGTYLEYPRFGFMIEREKRVDQSAYVFAIKERGAPTPSGMPVYKIQNQAIGATSFFVQDFPQENPAVTS